MRVNESGWEWMTVDIGSCRVRSALLLESRPFFVDVSQRVLFTSLPNVPDVCDIGGAPHSQLTL